MTIAATGGKEGAETVRRYVIVSLTSGILFGALDAVSNANPLAQRLYEVYRPIARASVNAPAGVAIDLAYGFVLAGIFLLLYASLPGGAGWVKGISFGLLASFFGVVMASVSSFVMFNVPAATLAYALLTRLGEMLALGILYGLTLRPKTR
jgi:hypothetical protein